MKSGPPLRRRENTTTIPKTAQWAGPMDQKTTPDFMTVWKKLGEKQRDREKEDHPSPNSFWLDSDSEFLRDLGLTKQSLDENIRDLQAVLDKIGECRPNWDKDGPLYGKGVAPRASIRDRVLAITPKFLDAYNDFVKLEGTNEQEGRQRRAT